MTHKTVRIEVLSGTRGENGEHMAPGEIHSVSAVFAQSLINRGRARVAPDPAAAKVQHGDPSVTHGDPAPADGRRGRR